jgi:N-acetylglucosaminyldiphosphoundecaprenol N-acetyl-beta-D-mannosaminyltransferase
MELFGYRLTTDLADVLSRRKGAGAVTINTINPHSCVVAKKDVQFREALLGSDHLIPDGTGIVWGASFLGKGKIRKIAGADLHAFMLEKISRENGSCYYMGASQKTLDLIRDRLAKEYPGLSAGFHSPPFRDELNAEESEVILEKMNGEIATWQNGKNETGPVVVFVGMTAPKQEKWVHRHKHLINADYICSIGAVFDFYAGTVKRSSPFWINLGLEWLPRLLREPKRMYRRVFFSGGIFIKDLVVLKFRNVLK